MLATTIYAPGVVPTKNGQATTVTVTVTETDLIVVTDPRYLEKSQVSLYLGTIALGVSGGNTKIYLKHYFSLDNGVTWKQIVVVNEATGELVSLPDMIDSNSPASLVRDLFPSAANAYKVTAHTDIGTATIADATIMFRDN